jgi:murein DD-endopeptidase MepM/ murein hydrolase activator NlpD
MSSLGNTNWLRPDRLEYVPLDEELAVVRLLAGLDRGHRPPPTAALVAGASHTVVRAPVLGSVTHRPSRRMRTADHLLWRVTFALPLELLESPQAVFALTARDHLPTRLPGPHLSSLEALCQQWELGARGASLLSALALKRAAALGTAVAVAGSAVLPPAVALAVKQAHRTALIQHAGGPMAHQALGSHPTAAGSSPSVEVAAAGRLSVQGHASTQTDLVAHRIHHHRRHHHHRGGRLRVVKHSNPSVSAGSNLAQAQPLQPSGGAASPVASAAPTTPVHVGHHHHHSGGRPGIGNGGSGLSTISPAAPAGLRRNHQVPGTPASGHVDLQASHPRTGPRQHPHHRVASRQASSGGRGLPSPRPPAPSHQTEPVGTPSPSSFSSPGSSFWTTGTGMSSAEVALLSHLSGLYVKGLQPPKPLIPMYKKAGQRFHIPWEVLAAINSIETNYGRNLNVSSAGAVGWMQFMPATWKEYGITATGHGVPNPYDPSDAIFSAARYLAVNGGAHHLRKAVFAYNHAMWYVDSVLWRAGIISEHAPGVHHLGGYALPLDGRYMHVFGRTDDGVDLEDAPDGAAVYSMTPGVVTAVASDPGGFGPNYPVIRVTKGPLTGQYIYYGHVAASLVKVGRHVMPGQPIAVMGHTGDAVGLGHGHIEIGFSDSSGDPLNHHGPVAWTPSGAAMRHVLVALAAGFHIKVTP